MGFRTVAISNSGAKEEYSRKLGADIYLDMSKVDVGAELMKLGGAKVILATSPDSDTMSKIIPGIGFKGQVLVRS
jgi:alcohol dehydrogenase/propanol-preferring alcohol dehydrogenase